MDMGTMKKLDTWLRRQLFVNTEGYGACKGFVISHLSLSKVGNVIGKIVPKPGITIEDIDDLIAEIDMVITTDVEGVGGFQRYILQPTFENTDKLIGRFVIKASDNNPDDNVDTPLDSEPPTKSGITAQLMRHLEAVQKTATAGTGNIIGMQNRIITRQAEQIEVMQSKHIELIEMVELLKSQKHQRDMELNEAEYKNEQRKEVMNKIMLLLPAAVNKLGGKQLLPQKTTASEQMIMSLMESLKPEQMGALQEVLSPDQQMQLFSIYENMRQFDTKNGKAEG